MHRDARSDGSWPSKKSVGFKAYVFEASSNKKLFSMSLKLLVTRNFLYVLEASSNKKLFSMSLKLLVTRIMFSMSLKLLVTRNCLVCL